MSNDRSAPRAPRDRHPIGFWFVFWGELAERACFYGMRTILALYLVDVLGFGQSSGAAVMQFFLAACYLTPLFGGWLADRRLGRYRTIMLFAFPYVVGQLVLAGVPSRVGLAIALPLLALGSGAIKPNTSTLMGLMYEQQKKEHLLGRAFAWFYAAINVGSAVASLALPLVRVRWGYAVALTIPAALMVGAFALFAAGRKHYPVENVGSSAPREAAEGPTTAQSIRRLAGVFAVITVFWFVYDQSASTWVFFARAHLDLTLFPGVTMTADQIQAINPVAVVALTPVFSALWSRVKISDPRKMLVGFGIVVGAMCAMAVAAALAGEGRVSVWWIVVATITITLAELCVSVVGLEFAFREAGPRAKSAVTAAFLLTVFVGNTFGGAFDALYERIPPSTYFALQAMIAAVATAAFWRVTKKFGESAAPAPARATSPLVAYGGGAGTV
jgi:proton-dependent oligopeptide transporter, POT family